MRMLLRIENPHITTTLKARDFANLSLQGQFSKDLHVKVLQGFEFKNAAI
jgi:hypothetical protein